MNTLRRLIGQKHLIEGKDDGPDDIMASLNAELRAASKGEVYVSWGGHAQSKGSSEDHTQKEQET